LRKIGRFRENAKRKHVERFSIEACSDVHLTVDGDLSPLG
jgi:hypothetical protein